MPNQTKADITTSPSTIHIQQGSSCRSRDARNPNVVLAITCSSNAVSDRDADLCRLIHCHSGWASDVGRALSVMTRRACTSEGVVTRLPCSVVFDLHDFHEYTGLSAHIRSLTGFIFLSNSFWSMSE